MEVNIEPLEADELDDFIKTYWAAFEPLSANMIMPMIYRNGLQEDTMEHFRSRILRQTDGALATHCFTAKDINSGDIIGVSWWRVNDNPPKTKADIDVAYEQACEDRAKEPPVEGLHEDLSQAYFRAASYSEMETVDGHPYMTLCMLAVNPKYHRRGAGSLLLKHGLEKADSLRLPVYLDCGVMGKPLYERYGFQVVGDFPLNCLDYGGRSDGRHWLMMRPRREEPQN
jgi:ribosomal protein S18 acetylase RimI-like enzyme